MMTRAVRRVGSLRLLAHLQRGAHTWSEGWMPFDTRKMVCAFESAGFTALQARVIAELLRDTLVVRQRENRELLASKGDYMQVKAELRILEKSDFQLLKSDVEYLEMNIEKNIARVNTELERIENRTIKYVLGSSFFLSFVGYSVWFLYKNKDVIFSGPGREDEKDESFSATTISEVH
mmetsp:Transcript_9258/g.27856  ORF Transcript_9258/g.27856 Transcript_9258/m.27856 type:complete len:178 (-) Transcript_9258:213-746(-)